MYLSRISLALVLRCDQGGKRGRKGKQGFMSKHVMIICCYFFASFAFFGEVIVYTVMTGEVWVDTDHQVCLWFFGRVCSVTRRCDV